MRDENSNIIATGDIVPKKETNELIITTLYLPSKEFYYHIPIYISVDLFLNIINYLPINRLILFASLFISIENDPTKKAKPENQSLWLSLKRGNQTLIVLPVEFYYDQSQIQDVYGRMLFQLSLLDPDNDVTTVARAIKSVLLRNNITEDEGSLIQYLNTAAKGNNLLLLCIFSISRSYFSNTLILLSHLIPLFFCD